MTTTSIDLDTALINWMNECKLTGEINTDRSSNITHLRLLASRHPGYTFGVAIDESWDERALLGSSCLARPASARTPPSSRGRASIDARLTVKQLAAYGRRLGEAVERDELILFATAHPAGLSGVYATLASAVRKAGGRVCEIAEHLERGTSLKVKGIDDGEVWQISSVCMRYFGGSLLHTHSPQFAEVLLSKLAKRGTVPDLVVADHGWAGAAGARGIATIGIADSNDPALFVAQAQGSIEVCVPMDDNLLSYAYEPVIDYILTHAGITRSS
ncbi:phosphatase [Arthrobacter psychrolactophilus]